MININSLLEMIDFEPNDEDRCDLIRYLNYELNGIEEEYENKIPKYFKNMLKHIKSFIFS
jgi:hypothetical protein